MCSPYFQTNTSENEHQNTLMGLLSLVLNDYSHFDPRGELTDVFHFLQFSLTSDWPNMVS